MGTTPYKSEAYKKWYDANRSTQYARVRKRKLELKVWFNEYKATLKCERCPEDDPICLDFHHRDPAVKEFGVSQIVAEGWGKTRILAKIAKCDVLCSNCHRKEHAALAQSG